MKLSNLTRSVQHFHMSHLQHLIFSYSLIKFILQIIRCTCNNRCISKTIFVSKSSKRYVVNHTIQAYLYRSCISKIAPERVCRTFLSRDIWILHVLVPSAHNRRCKTTPKCLRKIVFYHAQHGMKRQNVSEAVQCILKVLYDQCKFLSYSIFVPINPDRWKNLR